MKNILLYFKLASSKPTLIRGVMLSIVVGSILNLINQGDRISEFQEISLLKLLLTYLTPFCVSVHSTASTLLKLRKVAD